ncbi:unnamed protein product, partial [Acanthoscelides obtectus]
DDLGVACRSACLVCKRDVGGGTVSVGSLETPEAAANSNGRHGTVAAALMPQRPRKPAVAADAGNERPFVACLVAATLTFKDPQGMHASEIGSSGQLSMHSVTSSQLFPTDSFVVFRKDRKCDIINEQNGGGVI